MQDECNKEQKNVFHGELLMVKFDDFTEWDDYNGCTKYYANRKCIKRANRQ